MGCENEFHFYGCAGSQYRHENLLQPAHFSEQRCRQEWRHGTQKCVRHVGGFGIEEIAGRFSEESKQLAGTGEFEILD